VSTFKSWANSCFALLCFLPGSVLYHQGQRQGKQIKIPVQLARGPKEEINLESENFYDRAFYRIQKRKNKNLQLETFELKAYMDDYSLKNCIVRSVLNLDDNLVEILIFNTYPHQVIGALHLPEQIREKVLQYKQDEIILKDVLTGETYSREKEMIERGMFIKLESGQAHWFSFHLR
ncbi:MAG TPA: hypothetical protein PLS71_23905, partial [Leptospiraceae bacterium]|nr:hypothetical protein [Leptospiraceae bacterium]